MWRLFNARQDLPQGYFLKPTILTNVEPHFEIWQTEVFGPVLSVRPFHTEGEAVELANNTEYGLAGAVFSSDQVREKCIR